VAAPTGYLLCFGQAVSRTTYAALFAAIGTAFGAGDGTTTFNLPDFRGRVAVGLDNMGGVAAGRMAGFTTMGALGGVQSVTLAASELPSHNHGVTDPTHTHAVADPGHIHNISDPNHQHSFSYLGVNSGLTFTSAGAGNTEVAGANSGTTNFAATGISVLSGVTGIALFSTFTGISVNNAGGGQAHTNVQPSMAVNKIIKT
jgi:microcystin-dependent protein